MLRTARVWTDNRGQPVRFIWRDLLYRGRIVNKWRLQDLWWDAGRVSDRISYRRVTCNYHAFDPFWADAEDGSRILDWIHD